ncbi:MAG: AMP-binding protein, partial [Bradyrhizobium sp.]
MSAGGIERLGERSSGGKPSAAKAWLKAIELTSRIEAAPRRLFADVVEDIAKRQPERPALISEQETFTYGALAGRINQYARWAQAAGIKRGGTVCLLMTSRPDYVACWLGVSRVGGVVALLNTRLIGASLAHCINVSGADHIILAKDQANVFESARPHLARTPKVWSV